MKNSLAGPTGQSLNDKAATDQYETRCKDWVDYFVKCLGNAGETPCDDLQKLVPRIQAELNLADYKFKFRQGDHPKWFSHTPLVVSIGTFFLALVLGIITVYQALHKPPETQALLDLMRKEEQETHANLVLKVLEAPQDARQPLLEYLANTGQLDPNQKNQLERVLQKAQQSGH